MASEDLREEPDDKWAQMSLFWVLRDYCQEILLPESRNEEARQFLSRMKDLLPTMMDDNGIGQKAFAALFRKMLPEADLISRLSELSKTDPEGAYEKAKPVISVSANTDISLHEELGWIIYRYMKATGSAHSSIETRRLLRDYMNLKNERPSMLHSMILNFALNFSKGNPDFSFYRFFLLWNPANLRNEDLHNGFYNGKEIPSLISRICKIIVSGEEKPDIARLCSEIDLYEEEVLDLLREPYFWQIINLRKEGKMQDVWRVFNIYAVVFEGFKGSKWHSEMLKLAERLMTEQDAWRFPAFMKQWGIDNFLSSDMEEETDEKGNKYKPLIAKAAKRCFEASKNSQNKDEAQLLWLSGFYDKLTSGIADNEWIQREQAKIFIWLNKKEKAVGIYRKLLLEMSDKFYIWSELASAITDNNMLKIGLLSKALLIERTESFLGDTHLMMAEMLISEGFIPEALRELECYKDHRDKEGWKVSEKYNLLKSKAGPGVKVSANNRQFYIKYAPLAEEFAFSEIESISVVLADKWEKDGKTRCSFSDGKDVSFQINERRYPFIQKAKTGTVVSVKCNKETNGKEIRYIPLSMKMVDVEPWSTLPEKYGYIEYVNHEKKIVHLITQDSEFIFCPLKDIRDKVAKGDFVVYHEYFMKQQNNKKMNAANVRKSIRDTALGYFRKRIVVVDDVNIKKELIHYVAGPHILDGFIYLKDTDIRPETGDCLEIGRAHV